MAGLLPFGGEEKRIVFWGNCDKAVLLSNLLYHKIDGGESLQMYDLQAMFDCAFLKGRQQTSLSAAIEQLGLPPRKLPLGAVRCC